MKNGLLMQFKFGLDSCCKPVSLCPETQREEKHFVLMRIYVKATYEGSLLVHKHILPVRSKMSSQPVPIWCTVTVWI